MFPRIVVFKQVIGNDIEQRKEYAHDCGRVDNETIAAQLQPAAAACSISKFGIGRAEITERAEECCNKGGDNKKMTQLPGPEMFTYKLCIHFKIKSQKEKIKTKGVKSQR